MKTIKKAIETFEEIPECEEECISQKKYYMETDGNVHEIESDYMVIKDSDGNSISKIYLELKYMDEDIFSFAEVNCDEEKLKYRDNYEEGDLDFKIRYGLLRLSRDIKGNIIPFGEKIITPAIYDRICCNNLLTATAYTKEGLTYIDINPDSENFGKQMVPGILKHAVPFDIDYENFAECSYR